VKKKSQLPRLPAQHYQGRAIVFWTYSVEKRQTGWLDEFFHFRFREVLLHAAIRHRLVVPAYCLMPDHLHWLGMGIGSHSDQRLASQFVRKHLREDLDPAGWQRQPHDHVLREEERKKGAVASTCSYIFENPLRRDLVEKPEEWAFSGCLVPGYPSLEWRKEGYWELFWRIYAREVSGEGVL